MDKQELYDKLTDEQKQELNTLATVEAVISFTKDLGISLDIEAAELIVKELPDDSLQQVSGGIGTRMLSVDYR